MMNIYETVPATRVTFVVDEDTYTFLSKAHSFNENDELWVWEDSEDIQYVTYIPCGDCGLRSQMAEYACPYNEGYCTDCCYCEEHFPETLDTDPAN